MNVLGALALVFLGFPVLVAFACVWRGYALSVLWGWFAVSQFGLPALNIPQAIGIALIVSFLTHQQSQKQKSDDSAGAALGKAFGVLVLTPALALLTGWIVTKFL